MPAAKPAKVDGEMHDPEILELAKLASGNISLGLAEKIWAAATDGSVVTATERGSVEKVMKEHSFDDDAKSFLMKMLAAHEKKDPSHLVPTQILSLSKGQYKTIMGLRYEKELLNIAIAATLGGKSIDVNTVEKLWTSALDGPGITPTEFRTLEYIAANYKCDGDAREALQEKLFLHRPTAEEAEAEENAKAAASPAAGEAERPKVQKAELAKPKPAEEGTEAPRAQTAIAKPQATAPPKAGQSEPAATKPGEKAKAQAAPKAAKPEPVAPKPAEKAKAVETPKAAGKRSVAEVGASSSERPAKAAATGKDAPRQAAAQTKAPEKSPAEKVAAMKQAVSKFTAVVDLDAEEETPGENAASGKAVVADKKVEGLQCRPTDRGDYLRRLRSFRVPWWFKMPSDVSPIECARRGWVNIGFDVIQCECCGLEVQAEKLRKDPGSCARDLVRGHSAFCPWVSHQVPDPSKLTDREMAEDIERRIRSLRALRHYPVLADDAGAAKTLKALALAGWEYDLREDARAVPEAFAPGAEVLVRLDSGDNGEPAEWHPATIVSRSEASGKHEYNIRWTEGGEEDVAEFEGIRAWEPQCIRCVFCVRSVAVEAFDHRPMPKVGEADVVEAAATEAKGGDEERPCKAPRLEPPLPPRQGVWTPQCRVAPLGGLQAVTGHPFDQYCWKRFYCPMYSRAGDELPPLALKASRVHEEAARRMRGSDSADGTAAMGDAGEEGSVDEVVARAEKTLRAVEELVSVSS